MTGRAGRAGRMFVCLMLAETGLGGVPRLRRHGKGGRGAGGVNNGGTEGDTNEVKKDISSPSIQPAVRAPSVTKKIMIS